MNAALGLLVVALAVVAAELTRCRRVGRWMRDRTCRDPLTGLMTREALEGQIDHALARARRHGNMVAVLAVGLDRLKTVNDRHGHAAGDSVLITMAGRMQVQVREEDALARLGGDHFGVLLEQADDPIAAARVAERIIADVTEPCDLDDAQVFVGVSVGIATSTDGHTSADMLLRDAAMALQRAKERTKGGYELFEPADGSRARQRLALESDLRRALREDELVAHYQPEVSLTSGRITGAEALVRWGHPDHGLLLPDRFIPLAEETGLVNELGAKMLDTACRALAELDDTCPGHDTLQMSVNVSGRQLQRRGSFVSEVAGIVGCAGIDPARLTLEITESVLIDNTETAIATLDALRDLGVNLALDDFGTGYSSLCYLKYLPVSTLKLDRQFVAGVSEPVDLAIISSVVGLAGMLGIAVTAEGITTADQCLLLRRLGCTTGQGYWFSKAVPVEEFRCLLEVTWPVDLDDAGRSSRGLPAGSRRRGGSASGLGPISSLKLTGTS